MDLMNLPDGVWMAIATVYLLAALAVLGAFWPEPRKQTRWTDDDQVDIVE